MPLGPQSTSSIAGRVENDRRASALTDTRAARTVAGRAGDAQDCRLLLEMLGIDIGDTEPRGPVDR